MAQAFYCPGCRVGFSAELRGKSCPSCGEELIHGRIPASRKVFTGHATRSGRAVWDYMLRKDLCSYCFEPAIYSQTIDHIQPKALGGSKGSWTNRTAACFSCNQSKAHTPLLFYLLEQNGEDITFLKTDEGKWPLPKAGIEEEPEPHEISPPPLDYWRGRKN